MGRKKDKELERQAAWSWLNELEGEIIPGVTTKEERKCYSKQARVLRGALERRSLRAAERQAAGGKSGEPSDPQAQANLHRALTPRWSGPEQR